MMRLSWPPLALSMASGAGELALLEDAENQAGVWLPRQVAALDPEFHGESLLVEGVGVGGTGCAPSPARC